VPAWTLALKKLQLFVSMGHFHEVYNLSLRLFLCFILETTEHIAMNFKTYTKSYLGIYFFLSILI